MSAPLRNATNFASPTARVWPSSTAAPPLVAGCPAGTQSNPTSRPLRPTDAAGVCIVDRQGQVLAADGIALGASLIGDPQTRAALDQLFHGAAELVIEFQLEPVGNDGSPMLARLRRLESGEGPMALVEFFDPSPVHPAWRLDPLTQLADRNAIARCVEDWRRQVAPQASQFAALFLDLDDFKQVNDRFGHAAGDDVLKTLALRWHACVREHDLVARYGGDEFVVLLKDAATTMEIEPVVQRLRESTTRPVDAGGLAVQISVSVGVEICRSTDRSIDDLIDAADRDMYARKHTSRP